MIPDEIKLDRTVLRSGETACFDHEGRRMSDAACQAMSERIRQRDAHKTRTLPHWPYRRQDAPLVSEGRSDVQSTNE